MDWFVLPGTDSLTSQATDHEARIVLGKIRLTAKQKATMTQLTLLILTATFLLLSQSSNAQKDTTNQKVNGKKEGYWIKHRTNGQIKSEGYFLKGEKTGYWKIYNKDGMHHSEGKLVNGKRIGEWYFVHTASGTKLDMTRWDGKGNCAGGATLSW